MKVWLYPDKKHEELGARRWRVTWVTPPPSWSPDDPEGPDPDRMVYHYADFCGEGAEDKAVAEARRRIGEDFYGCPTVSEQVVDWYVQEDNVGSWENVGDPIYVE